jgi:hypothetical protein
MAEEDYSSWTENSLTDLIFCLKTERKRFTVKKILDIIDAELTALEQAKYEISQIPKP